MAWLKCSSGCIFEVADSVLHTLASALFTCPTCHRQQLFSTYARADKSRATALADKVHAIQIQTPQQAIDAIVIERIKMVMELKDGWFTSADVPAAAIYTKLVRLLINAEITSNFPTARLPLILKSGQFVNMWKFEVKDRKYAAERDSTEKTVFDAYNSATSSSFVPDGPRPSAPNPLDRPVYLALNVGNFLCGGAPNYGLSYAIFKDAVKTRCTFTATDTIQMSKQPFKLGSSDLYGFGTISGILLRITDRYLKFLASYANNAPLPKVFEFIEAHAWGELFLHQDIKALVISEPDLEMMVTEKSHEAEHLPPDWVNLDPGQRKKEIGKLRTTLENFCAEHKIELYYLNLDGSTMNSTLQRDADSAQKLAAVAPGASGRWYMVSPQDRARIGLDRLNALTVGRAVSVVNPATGTLLARGTVNWEHGNSMTVQFDEVLAPQDGLFSFGGAGSSLRFDKGSEYIRL